MGQNQSDQQASIRAVTGTAWTYEGDWHALFDQAGIASGDYNGRLLAWINQSMGASYAELNGAMSAFAASQSAPSWNEMGTFTPGSAPVAAWDASTSTLAQLAVLATHTRTSLATMFDSTGKLTYAPNNLLKYSNTFSNAAWTKSSVTVTGGISDPLGGTAASTITATAGGGLLRQDVTVPSATKTNGVVSVWARRRTGSGAITLYKPDASNTTVPSLTGSWQQFSAAGVGAGSTFSFVIQFATNGDAIDIYAAGVSAVTWETLASQRPADQVITTSSAYYGPRIDYDITGTLKGLLIWESRKWDALWSRDFTNAAWVKTNVTAALNQTGIDGVSNSASSLTATAINGTVLQNITLASSARAQSAWVKRLVGSGVISMTIDGGATWTDVTSQISASYAWVTVPTQTLANPSVGFKFATSGDSIAVDFFGNEGGTFPSPRPIPVTNAAVTVAADVEHFIGPALTAIQGASFSAIVEAQTSRVPTTSRMLLGANAAVAFMYAPSVDNQTTFYDGTSGVATAGAGGGKLWSTIARSGISISGSSASLVMTGGGVVTGTHALPARTTAYLGSYSLGEYVNGWVRSFAIYNQRLADATLQTKSVVNAAY